ncbi:MAG: hypothetical protein AAB863_02150, partial [Patescibacteria group bacterium]
MNIHRNSIKILSTIILFTLVATIISPAIIFADDFVDETISDEKKVEICHIPPGNPDNKHTITISENAAQTHINEHGDTLGPCEVDLPPPLDPTPVNTLPRINLNGDNPITIFENS